jgi:hypothetical protein
MNNKRKIKKKTKKKTERSGGKDNQIKECCNTAIYLAWELQSKLSCYTGL